MKARFALALLFGSTLLSGCSGYGHLYPVQGPLASLTPPPVFTAKITLEPNFSKPVTVGAHSNDRQGKIAVALSNGEQFNGEWTQTYDKAGTQTAAAQTAGSNSLAAAWDTVFGKGYFVAHVLGTPLFVNTAIKGSQGTALQVEWYEHQVGTGDQLRLVSEGIAQDSKGNVYKLTF